MSKHIPEEIIVNIFSRLPVKSIKRFSCVCKPWLNLFSDPNFVKLCLKHALENSNFKILVSDFKRFYFVDYGLPLSFSIGSSSSSAPLSSVSIALPALSLSMPMSPIFDSTTKVNLPFGTGRYGISLLGTCNGVLSFLGAHDTVCFWNPATNEYKIVPSMSIDRPEGIGMIRSLRYGFGHDSESDVYKVVSLVDFCGYGSTVQVLTLGTEEWRTKSHVPYGFQRGHLYGVLSNEAVHWVANPSSPILPYDYDGVSIILSFDVKTEMFKEVPQPQNLNDPNHITLGEYGQKLCLIDHDSHTVSVNLYVMNEYGRSESWTRQIMISLQTIIPSFNYVIPVQRFRNGEILFETNDKLLILYDPKGENCRLLNIRRFNRHLDVTAYVESLVSPKQITLVKQELAGMVIETKGEA